MQGTGSPRAHLGEYVAYLRVKKGRPRSERHIAEVERRVARMLEGAERLEHVTPGFVELRMRELLLERVRIKGKVRTRSSTTVDYYRRELGSFFRWAKKRDLVRENPVDRVDPYEWDDARDVSRPFTSEEAVSRARDPPREEDAPQAARVVSIIRGDGVLKKFRCAY